MSLLSEQHILTGGEDANAANAANTVPDTVGLYALHTPPLMHFQEAGLLSGGGVPSSAQIDPNSVELFKHNVEMAHQHVVRIQQSAQGIIAAIERAYQPNGNYTMQASAEIISLKHMLGVLTDFLCDSGVGSLPLIPTTEGDMLDSTSKAVQRLYERRQRMQENAGAVASLLE